MYKYNWVLFSYNGNNTVARLIVGATQEQVSFFISSGGNQDDEDMFLFEGEADCQLVCVSRQYDDVVNDNIGNNRVMWFTDDGEKWSRIADLPCWIVDYSEYPEGKIVRQTVMNVETVEPTFTKEHELRIAEPSVENMQDLHQQHQISEMEREAEKEDPEFTGKNGL